MRAADVDLRSLGAAADFQDERLDVLADAVVLQRRLLGRRQDRFRLADVEHDRPRFHARNRPGDQLPFTAGVLVEDDVPLRLVKPLQHDLLGRLGVNPPEGFLVQLLGLDDLSDLGPRLDGLGLGHGHLSQRVVDLLDDQPGAEYAHLSGLAIDADVDVLVTGRPAVRRLDGLLDGPDELLTGDALLGI